VMANDEIEFPFRQWSLFEDLEQPGRRLKLDPAMMRAVYLENLAKHAKTLAAAFSKLRVNHLLLNTSKPFDDALMTYLAQRNR
jgi:hypothetical protein